MRQSCIQAVGWAFAATLFWSSAAPAGRVAPAGRPASNPAAAPAAVDRPRHTPFMTVLLRDWAKWDANRDDALSPDEVDRAVADPTITGDDAAAAAAIKLLARTPKIDGPLTRAYFAAYEAARALDGKAKPADAEPEVSDPTEPAAAGAAGREGKPAAADFDLYFARCKRRIARRGDAPLWPAGVTPAALDGLSQGPLGDCFFVASVGSSVIHRPAAVRDLVEPLPDGRFRATFPGATSFTFAAPTDGQLALSSTAGDGAWLAVLEQAFGKYRATLKSGSAADVDAVDGTDVLRKGGDSAVTIRQLTGHATRRITFPASAEGRAADREKVLPELRQALRAALDGHRLITAGVDPPDRLKPAAAGQPVGTLPVIPAGIQKRHVYAVVDYDEKSDVVELWNPHGQTFQPKGTPGPVHGYATMHGRFKVPLAEAYGFYTSFTFELDTPAPRPAAAGKGAATKPG